MVTQSYRRRPRTAPLRVAFRCSVLAAAALAAACAADGGGWVKPGVSAEQARADVEECQLYAQSVAMSEAAQERQTQQNTDIAGGLASVQTPGQQSLAFSRQGEVFTQCMEGRGYSRK